MVQAAAGERVGERGHHVLLPELGERPRAPLARENLVTHVGTRRQLAGADETWYEARVGEYRA